MFHTPPVNLQPFGVAPGPIQFGQPYAGAAPFFQPPWPPIGPEVLCANLISMVAAAAGQWLAGVIPHVFNATMTPAFQGFPPVMQAALPLSQPTAPAGGMLGFAELLNQNGITDLIVAEGQVPGPLLAGLRQPGHAMTWEAPTGDGRFAKVNFHRVDVQTNDGSWLLQADVFHGHQMKSSQLVRVHDAFADPRQPQRFQEGVERGYAAWQQGLADGEDARLGVVCEDGSALSGATVAGLFREHQAQERRTAGPSSRPASPQMERRDREEFLNACIDTRGRDFARGQERFMDEPERPSPPEALRRPPFVSRSKAPEVALDDSYDSEVDSDNEVDLRSNHAERAGGVALDSALADQQRAAMSRRLLAEALSDMDQGVHRLLAGLHLAPEASLPGSLQARPEPLKPMVDALEPALETVALAHHGLNQGVSREDVRGRVGEILKQQTYHAVAALSTEQREALGRLMDDPDSPLLAMVMHRDRLLDGLAEGSDDDGRSGLTESHKARDEVMRIEALLDGMLARLSLDDESDG